MYSTWNEAKHVLAGRFIRAKIFKCMTAISKNAYFDVLDDFVKKYNNAVHRTIKMKPVDVTSGSYSEYNVGSNEKDPKFKIGDHVRISNTKIFLLKDVILIDQKKF